MNIQVPWFKETWMCEPEDPEDTILYTQWNSLPHQTGCLFLMRHCEQVWVKKYNVRNVETLD